MQWFDISSANRYHAGLIFLLKAKHLQSYGCIQTNTMLFAFCGDAYGIAPWGEQMCGHSCWHCNTVSLCASISCVSESFYRIITLQIIKITFITAGYLGISFFVTWQCMPLKMGSQCLANVWPFLLGLQYQLVCEHILPSPKKPFIVQEENWTTLKSLFRNLCSWLFPASYSWLHFFLLS